MLFNSFVFLFAFLPLALLGYAIAGRVGERAAVTWLAICSLAFYGFWNTSFLILLTGSILFNYAVGTTVGRLPDGRRKSLLFAFGVVANVLLLVCYKYLDPTVSFLQDYGLIIDQTRLNIVLPLGISFFTFTQIGYLVDRRDHVGENLDFLRYVVFVTFFPHLIAGPILHIRDIGPQLLKRDTFRVAADRVAPGLALFILGLSKKVLIADPLGEPVAAAFTQAQTTGLIPAWVGAVSFALQLYFDFSGYSDMAMGLAHIFGFRFPINFASPYKTRGIIELWQHWHITLSRYLGLLLYNPLAMRITRWRISRGKKINRKALATPAAFLSMVALPTFYTMTIAGIWHGAGLQFIVFGLLNGTCLTINHAWRVFGPQSEHQPGWAANAGLVAFNLLTWSLALVFFHAVDFQQAEQMLCAMFGANGLALPPYLGAALAHLDAAGRWLNVHATVGHGATTIHGMIRLILTLAIVWGLPNTQQLMAEKSPSIEAVNDPAPAWMQWRPDWKWSVFLGALLCADLLSFRQTSVFLYFQF